MTNEEAITILRKYMFLNEDDDIYTKAVLKAIEALKGALETSVSEDDVIKSWGDGYQKGYIDGYDKGYDNGVAVREFLKNRSEDNGS